jgi:CHAT domain-containing protein
MTGEMEALRVRAEGLDAAGRHGEAMAVWFDLAYRALDAFEPGDPRTPAAMSRVLVYILENGSVSDDILEGSDTYSQELSAALGPGSEEAVAALETSGRFRLLAGRPKAARQRLELAASRAAESLGPAHPLTISARRWLAESLEYLGGGLQAASELSASLDACAGGAATGPAAPQCAETVGAAAELAGLLREAGDPSGADALAARAASVPPEAAPPAASAIVGAEDLAAAAIALGELGEGRGMNPAGLDDAAATVRLLALMHMWLGDYAGAAEGLRFVLGRMTAFPGPGSPDTLEVALELALATGELGDVGGKKKLLEAAIAGSAGSLPGGHPAVLALKSALAVTLADLGDLEAGSRLAGEVLDGLEASLGPDSPETIRARGELASLRARRGDSAGSLRTLAETLGDAVRANGPDEELASWTATRMGEVHAASGDLAAAIFFMKVGIRFEELNRADMAELDPEFRRSYLKTVESRYRELFSLLMREGRIREALAVLGLLKDEELSSLDVPPLPPLDGEEGGSVPDAGTEPAGGFGSSRLTPAAASGAQESPSEKEAGVPGTRPVPTGTEEVARAPKAAAGGTESVSTGTGTAAPVTEAATAGTGTAAPVAEAAPAGTGTAAAVAEAAATGEPASAQGTEDVSRGAPVDLFSGTGDDAVWQAYRPAAVRLGVLGKEQAGLREKKAAGSLSREEERRLAELAGLVSEAESEFLGVCGRIRELLGDGGDGALSPASWAAESVRGLQEALGAAGGGTSLLHAVSLEGSLWLLTVSPGAVAAREAGTGRGELARLAGEFRDAVADRDRDPRPAAGRLWDAVIAPALEDLEAAGTRQLMLSLDGELRYAPVAALWDGERWLGERYPTALYTQSTRRRLGDPPYSGAARVRALGVTAAWPGFPPLPGVEAEIAAVVRSLEPPGSPGGALEGMARLDGAFDRAALEESLSSGVPVVHLASHFLLDPVSLEDSFLLLGNGGRVSLSEFKSGGALHFGNLDLLTLSACDTASGSRRGAGREVESLGEMVQGAGASSVLATLMPVDDRAAPVLMREFYRLRYGEGRNKAEALRGAQLLVMGGGPPRPARDGAPGAAQGPRDGGADGAAEVSGGSGGTGGAGGSGGTGGAGGSGMTGGSGGNGGAGETGDTGRGTALSAAGAGATSASAPRWEGSGFSHPFYWSTFVLMGSFR